MRHLNWLLCIASLVMLGAAPAQSADTLGPHTVRQGESLYCIGRAYGVPPREIARRNALSLGAPLRVGQVLSIPAVPWERIPAGPVCAAQFASPYVQRAGQPVPTAESASAPTPTPPAAAVLSTYTVKRGDTLFRIARLFGVTVGALKAVNALTGDTIYPGQVLRLPAGERCDPAYPDVCIPPIQPDLDCAQLNFGNFRVHPPDPHGFDADGDGVGCEDFAPAAAAPALSAAPADCDPAYPDVCIPRYPPDLNCGDISHRRFRVLAPDPHNFDGDGDGMGCEG